MLNEVAIDNIDLGLERDVIPILQLKRGFPLLNQRGDLSYCIFVTWMLRMLNTRAPERLMLVLSC